MPIVLLLVPAVDVGARKPRMEDSGRELRLGSEFSFVAVDGGFRRYGTLASMYHSGVCKRVVRGLMPARS